MRRVLARIALLLVLLALVGLAVNAFLPKPVPVEAARVRRGNLRVTVEEEGRTRVRETYVVSMPLAGRTSRVELHPGDRVERGLTVLVRIEPTAPDLLDERAEARATAAVRVATAALEAAASQLQRAEVARGYATERVETRKSLARSGALAMEELKALAHAERLAAQDVRSAELAVRVATFEKEQAEAALLYARPPGTDARPPPSLEVRAPIDGQVLRVFQEDAATLTPGSRLLEVGDLADLEVVAEVLTREAARILPGAEVELAAWGGPLPLVGRVRRIEPAGFTKVSALGIEEQRVLVLVDLETPAAQRVALGDGYRVEVRILVARRDDVLLVPVGALFRSEQAWSVFRVVAGRADLTGVQIGASDGRRTEVVAGLSDGDVVVEYPGDKVRAGVRVAERER